MERITASSLAARLVIPRPHEELDILFTPGKPGGKPGADVEVREPEPAEIPENAVELEVSALPEKLDRQTLDSIVEQYGAAEGLAMADRLKVTALRTLAVNTEN